MPDKVKFSTLNASEYIDKVLDIWIENKKEVSKTQVKGRKIKNYATYRFKMFSNKTTTLMFMWAAYKARLINVEINAFQKWASEFFQNPTEQYKAGLANGSTKAGDYNNVKIRIEAIDEELEKLGKDIEQTEAQAE